MVDVPIPAPRPTLSQQLLPSQLPDNQLYALVRQFEASGPLTPNSKYLRAYADKKQRSIGYGTEVGRAAAQLGLDPDKLSSGALALTPAQAEALMQTELQEIRSDVVAKLKRYEGAAGHPYTQLNDDAIDALTSFAYNLGPGNLNQLTDNGNRDLQTVFEKIAEYNKAEDDTGTLVPSEGLTRRRKAEQDLFKRGYANTSANDTIGARMLLDIDTSPATTAQRVNQEKRRLLAQTPVYLVQY